MNRGAEVRKRCCRQMLGELNKSRRLGFQVKASLGGESVGGLGTNWAQ